MNRAYTMNHKTVKKLTQSLNLRGKQSKKGNIIPIKERLARKMYVQRHNGKFLWKIES